MRLSSGCQDSNQTLLLHFFWQPPDSSLYSSCLRLCFAVASFSSGSLILFVWASSRCLTGSRLQLWNEPGYSKCRHALELLLKWSCIHPCYGPPHFGRLTLLFARQVVKREHTILNLQNSQSGRAGRPIGISQWKPFILQDPKVKVTAIRSHNLVMAELRWESQYPSLGLKVASRVEKQMQMPVWTSGTWGLGDSTEITPQIT